MYLYTYILFNIRRNTHMHWQSKWPLHLGTRCFFFGLNTLSRKITLNWIKKKVNLKRSFLQFEFDALKKASNTLPHCLPCDALKAITEWAIQIYMNIGQSITESPPNRQKELPGLVYIGEERKHHVSTKNITSIDGWCKN